MKNLTRSIRKEVNRLSAYLQKNDANIRNKDWVVLRDWFFMMGNQVNSRLPGDLKYQKKSALVIDHRIKEKENATEHNGVD